MPRRFRLIPIAAALFLVITLAVTVAAVRKPGVLASLQPGKAELKSAGPLAFGPDGILFVGDSISGAVLALDTNDHTAPGSPVKIDVQGLDSKIAALVGVMPDQIMVNDIRVNPISKNVYLSVSRGRGPDAMPLIVRVNGSGDVSLLSLDNVGHASVSLTDAPASDTNAKRNPRMMTISDMTYVNGNLLVAGLSNEEWSSALRSIPFPFKSAPLGTTLQIWHSSHGRYETQAPVRAFVPYTISGQKYILAAYTCTPLVKIPVSELQPGAKVKGVTIADLGAGNHPFDMVPYKKDGHEYILIANSSLGLLKLKADNLENYKPIDSPTVVDVAGPSYDKLADFQGVQQLAQVDDSDAIILTGKATGNFERPQVSIGPLSLRTIALP